MSNIYGSRVFQTLWKAVGDNIGVYKTFPRLIGGKHIVIVIFLLNNLCYALKYFL